MPELLAVQVGDLDAVFDETGERVFTADAERFPDTEPVLVTRLLAEDCAVGEPVAVAVPTALTASI